MVWGDLAYWRQGHSWAGNPGVQKQAGRANRGEQATKQHRSMASAPVPVPILSGGP